jgi:hypothetical protein
VHRVAGVEDWSRFKLRVRIRDDCDEEKRKQEAIVNGDGASDSGASGGKEAMQAVGLEGNVVRKCRQCAPAPLL